MPAKDPAQRRETDRKWLEQHGGWAGYRRKLRERMTPEQREAAREYDRLRKRRARAAQNQDRDPAKECS